MTLRLPCCSAESAVLPVHSPHQRRAAIRATEKEIRGCSSAPPPPRGCFFRRLCEDVASKFNMLGVKVRPPIIVFRSTVVASLLSLLFAMPSFAGAVAQVNLEGGPGQQFLDTVGTTTTLVIAQTAGASGDSTGSAYANLASGVLRDEAHATNAYPGIPYAASSSSSIMDTVSFSGGIGQTGYLDYSFDGTLALNAINGPYATSGQMLVFIGSSFANLQLSAFQANCGQGTIFASCTVGTSVNKQGSIPFIIGAGSMSFGASLNSYAQFGNTAQFSNTGKLFLRTPEGVSFSSESGSFLTSAAPIFSTTVPEPQTYLLLLTGLSALGVLISRRQSPKQSQQGSAQS